MIPILFSLLMGLHSYEQVFELKAVQEQKQGDINQCFDQDLTSQALHYQFLQITNVALLVIVMVKGYHERHKDVSYGIIIKDQLW